MTFDFNKAVKYLLAGFVLLLLLYFGKTLFIPMCYGLFIAIVLYPVCRWLEQHHFPKTMAITVCLLLVLVLFAVLVWLVVLQVNAFRNDLPELKVKLAPSVIQLKELITKNFSVPVASQDTWWQQVTGRILNDPGSMLAGTFSKTTAALFTLFIIPVFAALFLYNRKDFVLALKKIAGDRNDTKLHAILQQTIDTYFHFIKGMAMVYIIVGALNSIGLLALGIKHAILFGFLTAVMTIIPYVGIFISALLPITIAWITKDSIWYPLGVVGVFVFVQYLEANVIFPRVVAAQLNISTWATLVAIIAGGILWGVNGMILFIPFVGLVKMLTDYMPGWEALNILLRRSAERKK